MNLRHYLLPTVMVIQQFGVEFPGENLVKTVMITVCFFHCSYHCQTFSVIAVAENMFSGISVVFKLLLVYLWLMCTTVTDFLYGLLFFVRLCHHAVNIFKDLKDDEKLITIMQSIIISEFIIKVQQK